MSRTQNVSEQNQKLFLCPGHKICVRNKCCACGQTGKHLCRQQCVLVSFTSTLKVNKFSVAVRCSALVVNLKIVKSEGKHRYTRPLSNQKEREKWITWIGRPSCPERHIPFVFPTGISGQLNGKRPRNQNTFLNRAAIRWKRALFFFSVIGESIHFYLIFSGF